MTVVQVFNKQKDLTISTRAVKTLVLAALKYLKVSCDEVHINFVTERAICKLHNDFFNDPSPTDCITLPIDNDDFTGYRLLGEVFICPKASLSSHDPLTETTRYLIHTLLHLIGYEDADSQGRALMRRKERLLLAYFKKNNLHLAKTFV